MAKKRVTLPHLYSARWYQKEIWEAADTHNRIFLLAHRRSGKDYTCFNILVTKCLQERCIGWYILPTREQARKVIWDAITNDGVKFLDCIPNELIAKIDATTKVIYLINGSTIWLLGADADSLVGSNPKHIIFSEYALYSNDPWPLLQPILRANGGSAIFNTTPRGTNHAYRTYNMSLNNKNWKVINHSVQYTNLFDAEALEEIRKETTQELFDQEYLCKFIDGASQVFKNIERVVCKDNTPLTYEIKPYEKYAIGLDIAKVNDETVLTAINLHTYPFRVYPQIAFNQIDYPLQQARVEAFWYQYNKSPILMDETGGGKVFIDSLSQKIYNVEGFTFTERSRNELLTNLAICIEQEKIEIPNDEELIMQLKGFSWVTTNTGKQRMQTTLKHDDRCFTAGTLVMTDKGNVDIKNIKIGDRVLTRGGYQKVLNTGVSKREVIHNSQLNLTGTPEHPIITKNGTSRLDSIKDSDILYIWNEKQSCIEEKNITDIQNLHEEVVEFTTGDTISGVNHQNHYTDKYILITMEKYLKNFTYTTKTITLLIMNPQIYKHLATKIIIKLHKLTNKLKKLKGNQVLNKQKGSKKHLRNGEKKTLKNLKNYVLRMVKKVQKIIFISVTGRKTNLKKQGVVYGVKNSSLSIIQRIIKFTAQKNVGKTLITKKGGKLPQQIKNQDKLYTNIQKFVNYVIKNLKRVYQQKDFATLNATKKIQEENVFNLYIENHNEYFANNILVHNCMSLALAVYDLPHKPKKYRNDEIERDVTKFDANIYKMNHSHNKFRT